MPRTNFARSGDVDVAYQVTGDGPIDLVYVEGALTHLDIAWELPAYRRYVERLAEFARVVRFDKRGMGMSDRVARATTLEERMDDIRAVLDAVGSHRAVLMGESEGGPLSMLFAAAHPDRTAALVLQGAEVRELIDDDWPWGESTPDEFEAALAVLPDRWGLGRGIEWIAPSVGENRWAREWLGRLHVNSQTPSGAAAFMRMAFGIDVRDVVPTIAVPTLVLHAAGDRVCHVENGRYLARTIPGATYVELPGSDHVRWFDPDRALAEVREFLTGSREAANPDRVLATILFTDIVESTRHAAALGDRRWRELVETHHAAVRRELARYRGTEIDTAGDGFLITFDGPARAIRCAAAIIDALRPAGLEIRAGVHTGEVELLDRNVAGLAVHVGARISALAASGQILVSSTVRDLVAGSGILFEDRGSHELKGVPGMWRVFAVSDPAT
jgi:class 3 adenylate cyclase